MMGTSRVNNTETVTQPHGSKPRLLDLFCGAGGCSVGYARAGFEVVGVDIKPQKNYPFEFHQADAMTYPLDGFDAIHASPPCQGYSVATPNRLKGTHPNLVASCRERLNEAGIPWVMENVYRAPMRSDFLLCGCHFNLGQLRRKRIFETNWSSMVLRPPCVHTGCAITVAGHGTTASERKLRGRPTTQLERAEVMGIDWMNRDELAQAIPPAYTHFIGNRLMAYLQNNNLLKERTP